MRSRRTVRSARRCGVRSAPRTTSPGSVDTALCARRAESVSGERHAMRKRAQLLQRWSAPAAEAVRERRVIAAAHSAAPATRRRGSGGATQAEAPAHPPSSVASLSPSLHAPLPGPPLGLEAQGARCASSCLTAARRGALGERSARRDMNQCASAELAPPADERAGAGELPAELIVLVLLPLSGDVRSLCAAACVARPWRRACGSRSVPFEGLLRRT